MGLIHLTMNKMKPGSPTKRESGAVTYDEFLMIEPVSCIMKNDITIDSKDNSIRIESRQ